MQFRAIGVGYLWVCFEFGSEIICRLKERVFGWIETGVERDLLKEAFFKKMIQSSLL